MILDLLIQLLVALLDGILGAMPTYTIPPELSTSYAGTIGQAFAWANGYFPLLHLGIALGVLLAARLMFAAWAVAVWVYDRFPFKAT